MNQVKANLTCLHCGNAVYAGESFCCEGCHSVYDLLISKGLGHYYDLRNVLPMKKSLPVSSIQEDVALPVKTNHARFYLEGIHCLGCLWLLEKLPEIDARIRSSNLDFMHQILSIEIHAETMGWDEVLKLIHNLGYSAKVLEENNNAAQTKDHRTQLMRLGVAGFCAGNIMLLSVSVYGGADPFWRSMFGWLSFALALPVFFYSAIPLFRSAFMPLAKKRISVDLAIALALISGMIMSIWSLIGGNSETYFDSLTMLVFLLLSTRYFLNRLRQSLGSETPYLSFLHNEKYERIGANASSCKADDLQQGDFFILKTGQTLPVDCELLDSAHFDLSMLNGESKPVKFLQADSVESGAKLLSASVKCKAKNIAQNSRMAKITGQIQNFQMKRSETLDFSERAGRYFVAVVLAIAFAVIYNMPNEEGFRRALALAIVTCPCVLAFAVPLTFARALQIAARQGILFKNPEKIEALAEAKELFLDKTGTITNGNFEVLGWEDHCGDKKENQDIAFALESNSSHPIAKAIVRFLSRDSALKVENFIEKPGTGVSGYISGEKWEMRAIAGAKENENKIGLFCDGELHSLITLGDSIRAEAKTSLQKLSEMGFNIFLLSGDHIDAVKSLASNLQIKNWKAALSPEQKAQIVEKFPHSIMVGDGANDGIAFQAASTGIAVQGSMDISLKNADICFTKPGITSLPYLIQLARNTRRLVRINFLFTLSYNIFAGYLAVAGKMSPLLAAILMPLSALTVFLFTQWQTKERI